MMSFNIVKMGEEHVFALSELEKKCFSTPWSEQGLRVELSNFHSRFFVAVCDCKPVGYIGSHNILGEVYITNVAVNSDYRKQGVGKALIDYLKEICKSENAEFITHEVRKSNYGAIS